VTTPHDLGDVVGRLWDTFLLGSRIVMVTAVGLVCEVALTFKGHVAHFETQFILMMEGQ
jgi:hypothetical protein